MTKPDKCPKCGDKRTPYDHGLMVWPFACDSYTDQHGRFKQSPWCVDRERANREHERAEKWKALAVKYHSIESIADVYSATRSLYECDDECKALLKEEEKE